MRLARFCIAVVMSMSIVACSTSPQAQATQPASEAEIRNARIAQNAAIGARDADSVASFWTQDVAVTAGLGFVLRGRDAYRAAFGIDAPMVYNRAPGTIVVSEDWPLAWEEGTWVGQAAAGQAPATISGKYSAQWVKQGGRWQIRSELFVALDCTGVACEFPLTLR